MNVSFYRIIFTKTHFIAVSLFWICKFLSGYLRKSKVFMKMIVYKLVQTSFENIETHATRYDTKTENYFVNLLENG